ncbi:MAG: HD domain-containing protein [Opitutales bacterium]|nr:HD domain-containing protein [Opitutales bacterium]
MSHSASFLSIPAVKQLPNGAPFQTVVALRHIQKKIGKTGNPYLQIEVGDAMDTLLFNCFEGTDPLRFFQTPASKCPRILRLEGNIDFYNDKLSPRVTSVQDIPEDQYETYLPQVVEAPDEPVDALQEELHDFINQIHNTTLKDTVRFAFEELGSQFTDSIGAVFMHHAYVHGLLEHTVHVARVVQALLSLYPEINPDLSLAGALLHDIGKVLEYQYTNEGMDRTTIGRLQGHVVLGYRLVRSAALRKDLNPHWLEQLEHIILSHQSEPEWGAAVVPATPEAILVSLADNLDARMGMVHQELKKAIPSQIFSDFIPGLDTKLFTQGVPDCSASDKG